MAYKMTMKRYGASQQATVYSDFVAFIQAIGWTLYHDINASTKVFTTAGESGTALQEFLWTQVSGTTILFRPYVYWNIGAGSGLGANAANASNVFSTAGTIYMFGDKDYVFLGYPAAVSFIECVANLPVRFQKKPYATINGALVAGANVVAAVSDTEGFLVNNYYQIVDNQTGVRTRPKIIAVNPGVSVTIETLSYNISNGAIIGIRPSVFCTTYTNASNRPFIPTCPLATEGTGNAATTQSSTGPLVSATQDLASGLYRLPRIVFSHGTTTTGIIGLLGSNLRYPPIDTVGTLFPVYDNSTILGVATGGGNDYLDDAGAAWGVNALVGKTLVITGGTGADQAICITANTATRITVGQRWAVNPNNTSVYLVTDRVYRHLRSGSGVVPLAALVAVGAP